MSFSEISSRWVRYMSPLHQMSGEEECSIYYKENGEFCGSNSILADIPEFLARNQGWDIFAEAEMIKRILLILHYLQWANCFAGHALEIWKVHHHHWLLSSWEGWCRKLQFRLMEHTKQNKLHNETGIEMRQRWQHGEKAR